MMNVAENISLEIEKELRNTSQRNVFKHPAAAGRFQISRPRLRLGLASDPGKAPVLGKIQELLRRKINNNMVSWKL